MHSAFPKIYRVGSLFIEDLFDGEVEITEKLDGSQFSFGIVDGILSIRSKRQQLCNDKPDKMFIDGIVYVQTLLHTGKLIPDVIYYCEYLQRPKHNLLKYNKIPTNNLMLYGVKYTTADYYSPHFYLTAYAAELGIDVAPLLYKGKIDSEHDDVLTNILSRESYLGGCNIEGVVVKRYRDHNAVAGTPWIIAGKYLSDEFKEIKQTGVKRTVPRKDRWSMYKDQFRTDARWLKAIQHLRDDGELSGTGKDIGKLLRELNLDIISEEKDNIKDWLWDHFGKELLKEAGRGFGEFYIQHTEEKSDE